MRITIIQDDGVVGVNGVFRRVDLSELDAAIRVIHFDTARGAGVIEYDRGATMPSQERDEAAEEAARAAAGDDRAVLAALQPIYRTVQVPRPNERISDFTPYLVYTQRWQDAAPPPPAPSQAHDWDEGTKAWVLNPTKQAELTRLADVDAAIGASTFGTSAPKTVAELKAMTAAEYNAWFDANFDTVAKLIGLLKRLTLVIIRRLL